MSDNIDKYSWTLGKLLDESADRLLAPIINESAAKKAGKKIMKEKWEEYQPEYGSSYEQAIHVFNKLNLLSSKPAPGRMYYVFTPTVTDNIDIPPKQPFIAQYVGSRSGSYVFKTADNREVSMPGVMATPDDNGVTGTIVIGNTERYDMMREYLKNKFKVDIPPAPASSTPAGSTVAAEDASTKMFLETGEEVDEPKVVRRKTQLRDGSTSTHWVVLDYSGEMAGGQGNGFSDLSAARAFLKANRKKLSAPPDDINEELIDEDLRKWFKEKWVRFNPQGKIMGPCARGDDSEGKPKCLPQSKAHSLGKKGRASAAARKRREDPNPERSGAAINVNTKKKKANEGEEQLDELKCWPGYTRVQGVPAGAPFSCKKKKVKKTSEAVDEGSYKRMSCPECGGPAYGDQMLAEKKDACYHKVKSRYRVWPSAYASGALSKCRKVGAKNWGNKSKK